MNKQPLLICVICFSIGIIIQDFIPLNQYQILGYLLFSLCILGLGFIKNLFFDKIKSILLLNFFISLGVGLHFFNTQEEKPTNITENQESNIVFKVHKKLNSNKKNKRYEVEITNLGRSFLSILSIPKENEELDFLHLYATKAYINWVEKPQHDFQFDYQKFLARQKIYTQSYSSNKILPYTKNDISFSDRIKQKRFLLLQKIDNSFLQSQTKALLRGIILADRTEINQETINNFSRTGLIHILAISGTHIGIIFSLILLLISPLFTTKYRKIPIIISISGIWIFALFIGLGNSVTRSCIMISIYYIMVFLQRKPNLPHSMALAGFLILIADTHQIFNIGFQLSFTAVLGIYWLYSPINQFFKNIKNPILRFLSSVFSLSLSALLSVIPLTLYYFHQLSILSVFINTISIFIAQIFIIVSFVVCFLFATNLTFNWILKVYDIFAQSFLKMISLFSDWDFTFMENIPISILEIVILTTFIYFIRKALTKDWMKNILKLSFLLFLFLFARTILNFYHWQKEEVLTHSFFKQNTVSIKQKDQVLFLISDKSDVDKLRKNIFNPYITFRRINKLEIKRLPHKSKIKIRNTLYEIK